MFRDDNGEAARTRGGADNDGPGVLHKAPIGLPGLQGVRLRAHRMSKARRAEPRDFLERKLRTGGDHEVVVGHLVTRDQGKLIARRIDGADCIFDPFNALRLERLAQSHARLLRTPPTYGNPGVGRRELKVR